MPRHDLLLTSLVMVAFVAGCGDEGSNGTGNGNGNGGSNSSWTATYSGFTSGSVSGTYVLTTGVGGRGLTMQGSVIDGNPFGDQDDGPRITFIRVSAGSDLAVDQATFDYTREQIEDCSDSNSTDLDNPLFTLTRDDDSGVAGTFDVEFECGPNNDVLNVTGSFESDDPF